jgi:hypothetical protein
MVLVLVAISACGSKSSLESSTPPSETSTPSTTPTVVDTEPGLSTPATELPTSSVTPSTSASQAAGALDLVEGTMFGFAPNTATTPDDAISRLEPSIGAVTWDTQWQPMPTEFACTDHDSYRTLWWGDVRMTFETSETGPLLTAWSVGDAEVLAPIGPLPTSVGPPTGVAADDGIGLGSSAADVEASVDDQILGMTPGGLQVVSRTGLATIVYLDSDQRVMGIGSSRNDCGEGN